MPKKSRKRAAKYSELSRSRARRRKQLERVSTEPKAAPAPAQQEITEAAPKKSPAPKISSKPQAGGKQPIPDYRYVRDDLKRVGIMTGAVVVLLIILAFVLR